MGLSFHLRHRQIRYFGPHEKSMEALRTSFETTERHEGVAFEAAAVLASPGPLGVITMGTLPLSLIAFGWIRRQKSDGSLALRPAS